MAKSVFKVILLFLYVSLCQAQGDLFQDKSTYITEVKKIVEATKNRNLIATVEKFETDYWNKQLLDDINKNKITKISLAIKSKGYSFNVQGIAFLNSLMKALDNQEMNSTKLQNYLETVAKTVDFQEVKVLNNFLLTAALFLEKRHLFYSFNNYIQAEGGSFEFSYAGFSIISAADVVGEQPQQNNTQGDPVAESQPVDIFNTGIVQSFDGPLIKVENANLLLISRFDTLIIQNTKGSLQLIDNKFLGSGGKVTWANVASDLAGAEATFADYGFNVSKNELLIENTTFTNPSLLENTVQGILEYKPPASRNLQATNYPKFTSNTNDVVINKLSKSITYVGAFSLIGRKFSSTCVDEKPSTMNYNDGKNRFLVSSNHFIFRDSSITALPASIIVFIGSDSILHPGLGFSYEPKNKSVRFKKEKGLFQSSLFRDTYHGFEFAIDQIDWNIDSDSMNLTILAAKRQIPAIFKSTYYFNSNDFQKMIGVGTFHPLKILQYYLRNNKVAYIILEDLAKTMKLNKETVAGSMADLDRKGFVTFDPSSGQIIILPKGTLFLQAFEGKSDYDNLYIPSLSPELPNATIKFGKDNPMIIRGVNRFFVSDSSHVFAIPDKGIVKVYQNHDLYFDGVLIAGYFLFKGSDFQLHYNDFEVKLTKIDTLKFLKSKTKASSNNSEKQFMNNNLVYSKGTLFINDPENKSGKKNMPEYPRFDAETGAYVYFTGKEILGGAYDRRVYFKIPPFKTDSVKSTEKSKLKFKGKFNTSGVLPDFEEELKVMPDNSLGFVHKAPTLGYDVFNGKAKFFGTISLNNEGIRGEGYLKYHSSTWYSSDFVFYQDSIVARGAQAKIMEKIDSNGYFPDTDIADYELKYSLIKDTMFVINFNYPFELYKKTVQLEGNLAVSPNGVSGSGLLEIKKERVIAPKIEFNQKNVVARHAVLNSKLPGYTKNSLEVNNVKITFILKDAFAYINPEIRGVAGISFPLCAYATSIENAKWDLTKKTVSMTAENPDDISKSYFLATNPKYDSLVFNGAAALYDINKKQLKIEGVPYIKSSDSKIIPDSGKVQIGEEGYVKTLKKAQLVIDTLTAYHHLVKGKIEIESKYKFSGSAVYRYSAEVGDTVSIPFSNFYTEEQILNKNETSRYTASQGDIAEGDKFYVAPRVLYKGKVKLVAHKQTLLFDGMVKMEIHNKELATDWIPYKHDGTLKEFVVQLAQQNDATVNKGKRNAQVVTNISEAGTEDTTNAEPYVPQQLYSGFFNEVGDFDLYSTLVSHRKNDDDHEIFSATGELRYARDISSFVVAEAKRMAGSTLVGNKYIYNDSLQTLDCLGSFTLARSDANFSIAVVGEARENIKKHSYVLDGMVSLKMNMPPKALDLAAKRIAEIYMEQMLLRSDTSNQVQTDLLTLKIAQFAGDKAAKNYEKHMADMRDYKPMYKFVPKLLEGMAFEKINFVWSNEHKAWYSKGKLKLLNILGNDINTYVDGYVEVKRTDLGDIVTIALRPNSDNWYYFNYQPGRLALLSSDEDFNTAVSGKTKGETGTPNVYTFVRADEAEEALFMKEFFKNYLGLNYDELTDYKQNRSQEQQVPKADEQTETNPEPAELEAPKKKKKKAKKADITSDEQAVEENAEPANEPANQAPDPVKSVEKKKAKKAEVPALPAVEESNPEPAAAEPVKEKAKPVKQPKTEKKKTKKVDITSEDTEPTEPAIEETNPEPVEAAPKKPKKKKAKADSEGVE